MLGPDTEATQARAINDAGVIVGRSQGPSLLMEPVRWDDDGIEALPMLGDGGDAVDHNERGEIVGYAATPESHYLNQGHAVLWADGEIHDLNALVTNLPDDVQLEAAYAISEDGIVVGDTCSSYCDPGKTAPWRGFVLIPEGLPVPEPQPVLADISSYARPITVAGPAPTAALGQWGEALHFAGGWLQTRRSSCRWRTTFLPGSSRTAVRGAGHPRHRRCRPVRLRRQRTNGSRTRSSTAAGR